MTTTVKTCFSCKAEKPVTEFYAHGQMGDGLLGKCKECTKRDVRSNRRKKSEYYAEYDRRRGNRLATGYQTRYREKNKDVYVAQTAVGNALRDGKIIKEPCFMCGTEKVHGHHVDYSKPLDVIWLCPKCHRRIHAYEDLAGKIRARSD